MYKLYRERREIHVPVRERVVFLTASEMIEGFFFPLISDSTVSIRTSGKSLRGVSEHR